MVGTGVALVLWFLRQEGGSGIFRNIFKEYED